MAVGRVDGHVVGDAAAKSSFGKRRGGAEAKLRRQCWASERFPAIGGLQQPNVGLRRQVRRKAPIADVQWAVWAGAQENVRVEGPIVIRKRDLHRRRKVLPVVGRAGKPELGTIPREE